MSTRDLIGYGANPPVVKWPNGARLAISVVVNYVKDHTRRTHNSRFRHLQAAVVGEILRQWPQSDGVEE